VRAVLAGYGFLGAQIARELTDAEFDLTVVRRSPVPLGIKFVSMDLSVQPQALISGIFDVAVFCLAPAERNMALYEKTYITAQQNFMNSIQTQKYVYISSTAVYPETPGTYDESSGSPHSDRAGILLAAEKIALSHAGGCVLRLAGLYSRERPIYNSQSKKYHDDKLIHFIHRDDAARAVVHAIRKNLTGIYNIHDGKPQRRSEIFRRRGATIDEQEKNSCRKIIHEKFFNTGFRPEYADYFAGVGLTEK
jgi:nucleoside-diphosphate-sugar epimerase